MPFAPTTAPKLHAKVAKARRHFYAAGWSYRSAAPVLGVSYQHLCLVLRGDRESSRLTEAVLALPNRDS